VLGADFATRLRVGAQGPLTKVSVHTMWTDMETRAMDIEQVARLLLGDDGPGVLAQCADTQTFLVGTLERSIDSLYTVTDYECNTMICAGKEPTLELGFLRLYSESLYFVILRLALRAKRVSKYTTQDAIQLACNTILMSVLLTGVESTGPRRLSHAA
jgi:hypothetical protein